MTLRSETPPSPGKLEVGAPPASKRPTTAMLKADVDSGATGDKVAAYDLGLSQLGTDDEAAGNAPSHERVSLARKTEAASAEVRKAAKPSGSNRWIIAAFCIAIGVIGAVLTLSVWLA